MLHLVQHHLLKGAVVAQPGQTVGGCQLLKLMAQLLKLKILGFKRCAEFIRDHELLGNPLFQFLLGGDIDDRDCCADDAASRCAHREGAHHQV